MANNRNSFLYIDDEDIFDFHHYQLSHPDWKLLDTGFQIAYLCEKHLGNTKKYLGNHLPITNLIEKLEKLTDECHEFDKIINEKTNLFGYSDANLLSLAIHNVNTRIKIEPDVEIQFRILHLINTMYRKSSKEPKIRYATLYIPESLCKLAINNNDNNLMSEIMPLMWRFDRDEIFTWSLLCGNIAIANSIIDIDRNEGRMKHQRWLEKNDAWPLTEPVKNEFNKKHYNEMTITESDSYYLGILAQAIAQHFPINEESSEFTSLFPFSNELSYKKVLEEISILNHFQHTNVIQTKPKNKIAVCVLFGESHLLSFLSVLQQRADIIILADVVSKQWMHIEHMLVCLDKSETPEEFIQFYLEGNPILHEIAGQKSQHEKIDIDYLRKNLEEGGSVEDYNFLSSLEKFKECKRAAKKLIFVQIKLDLMNGLQCQQLDALLSSHNATMTLCNLTNIHDYDTKHKLSQSVPLLLQSSPHCLVMYSTKSRCSDRNDLYTHVSRGLDKYFRFCLQQPLTSLKTLSATSNDVAAASRPISDAMLGFGIFSQKTRSLKLISSHHNNDKQENQRCSLTTPVTLV